MDSMFVVFLNDINRVNKLIQTGITVNGELVLVSPLSSPAEKIMLSNVPPFISDAALA